MLVVSWIFLIIFGLIGLTFLNKMYRYRINSSELVMMLFSIVVAALSAGVIFGGLTL